MAKEAKRLRRTVEVSILAWEWGVSAGSGSMDGRIYILLGSFGFFWVAICIESWVGRNVDAMVETNEFMSFRDTGFYADNGPPGRLPAD